MPPFKFPQPSNPSEANLLKEWLTASPDLRPAVTPDSDGSASGANYGTKFLESDYRPIPRIDLPFGVPDWVGDDAWGRRAKPRHNNGVERPDNAAGEIDDNRLVWRAPTAQELTLP